MKLRITISKYHSWSLCQISPQIMLLSTITYTNHAITYTNCNFSRGHYSLDLILVDVKFIPHLGLVHRKKTCIIRFYFFLLTSPNNKISDTTQKSVHILTGVQAGKPQQRAPITVGPRHRSLKNVKTRYYLKTAGDVPS